MEARISVSYTHLVQAAAVHALADVDDRVLVDAGAVVGAQELRELVFLRLTEMCIRDRAKDALAEQAVALGLEGAVVDGLGRCV